LVLALH